jgi:hypothetical protein
MAEGKIEVTVSGIVFSGDQAWLGEQLDKILRAATDLSKIQPPPPNAASGDTGLASSSALAAGPADSPVTLASYIKTKTGDSP